RVFRNQLRSALIRAAVPRRLFRLARSVGNRARPERIYPKWYTRRLVQRALDLTLNRTENGLHFQTSQGRRYYEIASSAVYGSMIQDRRAAGTIAGIDVLIPFRDRDLLAFLMAIPGEMVNLGGVPKGLLREAMRGVLPEAIRNRRTKADFTAINNRAVVAELPFIRTLFSEGACSVEAGLVDGDAVHAQLAAFGGRLGESDNALARRLVIGLGSLELWMREFFGDPDERATCRHAAKN
ncbi:MAG: hypothetical protein DMF90_01345, partial [Acidobacteria bacterium]